MAVIEFNKFVGHLYEYIIYSDMSIVWHIVYQMTIG